jgi:hypothetical protein
MNTKLKISSLISLFIILIVPYSYAGSSVHNEIKLAKEEILNRQQLQDSIANNTVSEDLRLLQVYSQALPSLNAHEKAFLLKVVGLIREFSGKSLITEKATIGDIDGDGEKDEIKSRIYEQNGVIKVESTWKKDKEILWQYTIENPYLWIGPSELFQYDTRNIWVIFTIAVNKAVPKLLDPSHTGNMKKMIVLQGIKALENIGIKSTKEQYSKYLGNFTGKLLQYGEPERGGGHVDIWYHPAKQFIPYYRP